MKKFLAFCMTATIALSPAAKAQQDVSDFYGNLLVSEEVKQKDNSVSAKESAGKLLNQKPKALAIEKDKVVVKRVTRAKPKPAITRNKETAPFGLYWESSIKDTSDMKVVLLPVERKDVQNAFVATQLPKPINDFPQVEIVFGPENELNRIIAYSEFSEDDAKASKVLALYNKYYKMLEKKYGNAKQVFVPKINVIEETIEGDDKKPVVVKKNVEEPLGGDDFLNSLMNGEAVLYATFENKDIGVILNINVDATGKSQITIDYKSLKYLIKKEQKTIDAL